MVYFPDNYFEKEIRNGFEVSSMMKRAWAGQIEVLSVIRERYVNVIIYYGLQIMVHCLEL